MGPAMAVQKELMAIPDFSSGGESSAFASEKGVLKNLKKASLMVAGAAVQKFMAKLAEEQEILMNLADMLIEIYVAESTLLRVEKLYSLRGEEKTDVQKDMAMVYLHHAVEKANSAGKHAIYGFATGDELRFMLLGLKRFTKIEPYNLKLAKRRVAEYVLEKGQYPF
jgi:hypothetical protein